MRQRKGHNCASSSNSKFTNKSSDMTDYVYFLFLCFISLNSILLCKPPTRQTATLLLKKPPVAGAAARECL